MLRMAQVQYIKDLYENEEKSLREISRITGHSFETVQKYAQKENWNEDNLPDTEPTSYPVLGEFIPIVDGWLEADRKVPRKQRHTAWRLFCRLRDEYGFRGSYSSVKRYTRSNSPRVRCRIRFCYPSRLRFSLPAIKGAEFGFLWVAVHSRNSCGLPGYVHSKRSPILSLQGF